MLAQVMIFLALLSIFAFVGVAETYLTVKINQYNVSSGYLRSASDYGIERIRASLATQLANHVEVADVSAPQLDDVRTIVCAGDSTRCQLVVKYSTSFMSQQTISDPVPVDTPGPCPSLAPSANYSETEQCNLALGGALDESRRLLKLQTVITNNDGRILGSNEMQVRIRLFRLSPYAQITGLRDIYSTSSVKRAGDIAGFDAAGTPERDTLLRSYAPCRNLPVGAPTPMSSNKYYWREWTGHGAQPPPIESKCQKLSGDTSHFEGGSLNDRDTTNSWGESN